MEVKCDNCYGKGYLKCNVCKGKGNISKTKRFWRSFVRYPISTVIVLIIFLYIILKFIT